MKIILSGLQWMIFMVAGAIAAPIAIADLYNLTAAETSGLIQNTIIALGIAGLLQALVGHKLPIHEGPAGLWWSIFTIYASLVGVLYTSHIAALQALCGGMVLSGLVFIILSIFKLLDKVARLFTPTITFVYMFLLIFQLSGSFMKGMLGISSTHPALDGKVLLLCVIVVFLTFVFGNSRFSILKQYSIILSIMIGWVLFLAFTKVSITINKTEIIRLPELFPFGQPTFDSGTITTALLLTLLLITNAIASIRLMESVVNSPVSKSDNRYNRAGLVAGITQLMCGCLGAVGSVPISGAAGYVEQTGMKDRAAFIIGCSIVVSISLLPPIMSLIASIPTPIGYSVTFVIFVKMFGISLKELKKGIDEEYTAFISGISLLVGIGLMFIPTSALSELSPIIIAVLNNGLICGSLLAIILEQTLKWRRTH